MTNKTTSAIDLVERLQEWPAKPIGQVGDALSAGFVSGLMTEAADTITRLQAALTDAEEVMSAAMVMIGARNDTLTEAQRQCNVNQAWHRLKSGREALSSVGGE